MLFGLAWQDCSSYDRTGVDGLPSTGQRWVKEGLLNATIVVPTNADIALEMLKQAITTNSHPRELTFTAPRSYPEMERLVPPPGKRSDPQFGEPLKR